MNRGRMNFKKIPNTTASTIVALVLLKSCIKVSEVIPAPALQVQPASRVAEHGLVSFKFNRYITCVFF